MNRVLNFVFPATLAVAVLPLLACPVFGAQSVSLAWNASTSPDVAGYNVYYGSASGDYTAIQSVGNVTSVTFTNLSAGKTYYFAVTTIDSSGLESAPSGEVSYAVPGMALALQQRVINGTQYFIVTGNGTAPPQWTLEVSLDLKSWVALMQGTNTPVSCWVINEDFPRMFFRLLDQ